MHRAELASSAAWKRSDHIEQLRYPSPDPTRADRAEIGRRQSDVPLVEERCPLARQRCVRFVCGGASRLSTVCSGGGGSWQRQTMDDTLSVSEVQAWARNWQNRAFGERWPFASWQLRCRVRAFAAMGVGQGLRALASVTLQPVKESSLWPHPGPQRGCRNITPLANPQTVVFTASPRS